MVVDACIEEEPICGSGSMWVPGTHTELDWLSVKHLKVTLDKPCLPLEGFLKPAEYAVIMHWDSRPCRWGWEALTRAKPA